MDVDEDKIDETVLALLWPSLRNEGCARKAGSVGAPDGMVMTRCPGSVAGVGALE
ncbi:hypothetical protein [Mesorhizobium sp. M0118]|uniref:hypothetical protein n=1 Tax=Mesorhizobium sp. M0118 TaxID=2956884 RepID=UPI003336865E